MTGEETVLDTYCGIGTIGLYMAPVAKHVYGVEVVPSAIKDAQQNATLNGFENTTFVCGKSRRSHYKMETTRYQTRCCYGRST